MEIIANAVDGRLLGASKEVALQVHDLLSYFVDGFEQSKAYKAHRWDGKSSFFSMRTQSFPAGFVPLIEQHLRAAGIAHRTRRVALPAPLGPDMDTCQARTGYPLDPRYDYQHETVKRLLLRGQMVAQISTGGGKSAIAALCYFRIGRPTLFVTTRQALAYQMKATMERMGERVGVIGDSQWEPNPNGFTVAMSQTLAGRLRPFDEAVELKKLQQVPVLDKDGSIKLDRRGNEMWELSPAHIAATKSGPAAFRRYQEGLLQQVAARRARHLELSEQAKGALLGVEFVILEEAHESSADGYYKVLRHCGNAHYRLALTATPFVSASEEANMRLLACAGPIGIKVGEQTLIERGILARPYFKYLIAADPMTGLKSAPWQRAYSEGIVKNVARNQQIVREALKGAQHGLSVLILITRREHGSELARLLKAQGLRAQFINGSSDKGERQTALDALANGKLQVLVASTILDVGVDVPSLGMIILAGGGKAEVGLRQRIGRGLREKKSGANIAFIVDFVDRCNRHLHTHSEQRRQIVLGIEGFRENVLPEGQDFDWSLLDHPRS